MVEALSIFQKPETPDLFPGVQRDVVWVGFQQKVLNANESYDSGEPGSETVSRFQKAPAREKEIKHKCDGDVGLCYLSFIDWNLQRKKNNNVTRSCPLYETPWSLSNPQHLCL